MVTTGDARGEDGGEHDLQADDVVCEDDEYIPVECTVESRTFTGVELLEGPSVLGLLQTLESPAAAALDIPTGPYLDNTPTWGFRPSRLRS